MDLARRELLIARIISGVIRLRVCGDGGREVTLLVKQPTREERYYAQELYQDALEQGRLEGSYTEEEILTFLRTHRLWDDAREAEAKKLSEDIEEFKVRLVQLVTKKAELQAGKHTLDKARERYKELMTQRHSYDHMTCEGAAAMARTRYLLACSLTYTNGQRLLPAEALWDNPRAEGCSVLLENAFETYLTSRLEEAEVRELARSDPWLSYWSTRAQTTSLFGVAAADLTEEQLRLQIWSQMYENIHQHPKCPGPEIVHDDDLCDGWLIAQKRERDGEATRNTKENAMNEKIREAEEQYIVVNSLEEAKAVEDMNSPQMKNVKMRRNAQINAKGEVQHVDFIDVRQECQMEAARLRAEGMRGR